MREYDEDDDNIRLYAPVLQRVIILAAVIIAVPVMMWTITTFIRSYVERPKAPTFQHLTLTEPSQSPPPASPLTASLPPPPQATQPAPAPLLADTARTASDGPASPPKGPPAPQSGAGAGAGPPPGAGASPSPPPTPTVAGSPASSAPAAPAAIASPNAPAPPTPTAGPPPRVAANASGAAVAPASADRGLAWPNSNTDSAPSFGAAPPRPPATTETATAEALPTPEPIKGRIPLPRHRPGVLTMAAMGPATGGPETAGAATGSIAPGRPVPLPRIRPADAPADTSPVPNSSPYGYQPGLENGR